MNEENTSVPEQLSGQTSAQGNEDSGQVRAENVGQYENYSLDMLSPQDATNLFGMEEASLQIAEMVGETVEQGEVRAATTEQSEELTEEETSVESADDDNTDEVEAEDDDGEDIDVEQPEKLVYDIKQLEEENITLSMKVDGEFKEFTMDDIQKAVGQSDAAEAKSRKAAEDAKIVEDATQRLYQEQAMSNDRARVMAANGQLASLATRVQQLDAQINEAEQNGMDTRELKIDRQDALNTYNHLYAGANQIVQENQQRHEAIQRERLATSDSGKKFLSDEQFRVDVATFLKSQNLGHHAVEAIVNDADLTKLAIGYYEAQQSITPKSRKSRKKTFAQTMGGRASTTKKPVPKQQPLSSLMKNGSISLADLNDNKHLLG